MSSTTTDALPAAAGRAGSDPWAPTPALPTTAAAPAAETAAHLLSPVFAYLPKPSMLDFAGHMSAMFFLSGCNFRCGFCHNAALMAQKQRGLSWARLREACDHFRQSWVDAVVISGGEPTLCAELPELIRFFRERGFAIKLDTNGSHPEKLPELLPLVDAVAMDIKCSLERYPDFVSFADTAAIARSVELLRKAEVNVEFRTTVVPDVHTPAEMRAIGTWLQGCPHPYVLQPFLPRHDLPDPALRTRPRAPRMLLEELAGILQREFGLAATLR